MSNSTTTKEKGESYTVRHPQHSYAIFCITDSGNLFIEGDWGAYSYSWRAFGDNFKKFLVGLDMDYLFGKLEQTLRTNSGNPRKKITHKEPLSVLWNCFCSELVRELEQPHVMPETLQIVYDLAEWSKKYPRGTIYSSSAQPKMDGALIELEERAKKLIKTIKG